MRTGAAPCLARIMGGGGGACIVHKQWLPPNLFIACLNLAPRLIENNLISSHSISQQLFNGKCNNSIHTIHNNIFVSFTLVDDSMVLCSFFWELFFCPKYLEEEWTYQRNCLTLTLFPLLKVWAAWPYSYPCLWHGVKMRPRNCTSKALLSASKKWKYTNNWIYHIHFAIDCNVRINHNNYCLLMVIVSHRYLDSDSINFKTPSEHHNATQTSKFNI